MNCVSPDGCTQYCTDRCAGDDRCDIVSHTTTPKARRSYTCDRCDGEIPKGARYSRTDGLITRGCPPDMPTSWVFRCCEDDAACCARMDSVLAAGPW